MGKTAEDPLPPHDAAAEGGVLACVLSAEPTQATAMLAELSLDHFYDERHRTIFRALRCLAVDNKGLDLVCLSQWLRDKNEIENVGGLEYLTVLPDLTPSPVNFPVFLEAVQDRATRRAVLCDSLCLISLAEDTSNNGKVLVDSMQRMLEANLSLCSVGSGLTERIEQRMFSAHNRPPEPTPRWRIKGIPICTPGNITTISAPIKSGKSAIVGAFLAAPMSHRSETDCLGVSGDNPEGKALIHIDTEQSPFDWWCLVERALKRVGLKEPPPWLLSYCLTGFKAAELRESLQKLLERSVNKFGAIYGVLIDGGADLVEDVNDPEESNAFVAELHAKAIKYDCPIVGAIHFNPGTDKTRGHLGSQLERKAESNLRLEKNGESIVLYADKNRRAPILKDKGPRFVWSEEHQMHISVTCLGEEKRAAETEQSLQEIEEVFGGLKVMRRCDILAQIGVKVAKGKSDSTTRRVFDNWVKLELLRKLSTGDYARTY